MGKCLTNKNSNNISNGYIGKVVDFLQKNDIKIKLLLLKFTPFFPSTLTFCNKI